MKKNIALISFLLILLLASKSAIAQTNVTQNITQNTTWGISGSPYIIESDIQVYPNTRLTIEPGVEVVIHIGASLIIGGELIAIGEPANSIIFNSNVTVPASNQPAGIIFENTAATARYKGGFQPIFSYDHNNREVKLEYESGSIIENCVISGLSTGIELRSCYPYIGKSLISGCPYGIKINYNLSYTPKWFFLFQNTIENCSKAAIFSEQSSVGPLFAIFSGNTITNNGQDSGGAYVSGSGNDLYLFLFNNDVTDNRGAGIDSYNGENRFLYAVDSINKCNGRFVSVIIKKYIIRRCKRQCFSWTVI
jgi:hypothetical protein